GRPAAGGTGRRSIRRVRSARRAAAVGPRGAAGPRNPQRADRVRPPARTGGTSAARGGRGSGWRGRPLTPNLALAPCAQGQFLTLVQARLLLAADRVPREEIDDRVAAAAAGGHPSKEKKPGHGI